MLAMIGALIGFGLGVWGILRPHQVGNLVGIEPVGGLGLSEIRATYGGLFLGMSATCLYFRTPEAYLVAGVAWCAAGVVRLAAAFIDRPDIKKTVGGIVMELGIGGLHLSVLI
jgi:hypothetical protein